MADISRYKGGAAKAKRTPVRRRQIAGSTQTARTEARAQETRAMNPASQQPAEQNENDRRTLDLSTGSFVEEIPVEGVRERGRRISTPRARVGGVELEPTDEGVRGRVRFASGGVVTPTTGQRPTKIKPPRGEQIEFGEGGKRRIPARSRKRG